MHCVPSENPTLANGTAAIFDRFDSWPSSKPSAPASQWKTAVARNQPDGRDADTANINKPMTRPMDVRKI